MEGGNNLDPSTIADYETSICLSFKQELNCPSIITELQIWTASCTANWANRLKAAAVNSSKRSLAVKYEFDRCPILTQSTFNCKLIDLWK